MIPYYETPPTNPPNLSSGTVDKYVWFWMENYSASPLFDWCLIPQVNLSPADQLDLSPPYIRCDLPRDLPRIFLASGRKF